MCQACFSANDRAGEIAAQATQAARPLVEARISAIRSVIEGAEDFDAAAGGMLNLVASWTPKDLGKLLGAAMELAAWEGREAVFLDMDEEELTGFYAPWFTAPDAPPPLAAFADDDGILFNFQPQIDFLKQKRPAASKVWTDKMFGDHDREFVVAGVTDIAMAEEFHQAILGAIEGDGGYESFAADFDRLVEKYGWSYNGGREWRIRTIIDTNVRTSYMAGRLAMMRDPDVVRLQPWWQYIHGESRTPLQPRPMHLSWDGLLARYDDPWWDKHFPPNDWLCSCGVRAMSERRAKLQPRWGDKPPADIMRNVLDRPNQRTVQVPQGIGLGWDYQPGNLWERGLVPSKMEDEAGGLTPDGRHAVQIDTPEPIEDLVSHAVPFRAKPLPLNLTDEQYVQAFLAPFGAEIGKAVPWTDATGTTLPISDELFRETASGAWKIGKRDRASLTAMMAETLSDPDEIWVGLARKVDSKTGEEKLLVDRRYIRTDGDTGLMIVFEVGRKWWEAITAYNPTKKSRKPDLGLLDKRRGGKLVFKREK